ncbi:MAG: DUF5663 domain-containing protein [bacterium]|nr:DUF5663 domain-containing protein [bacterium]MDZ4299694.1 DUF5663 domain-containing protein [Candidatus Sungbacteria bacterium]
MNTEDFLDASVLALVGLEMAPQEEQDAFLAEATRLILLRLAGRIKNELSEENGQEFEQVFGGEASGEERATFLETHVPDFENILLQEVLYFKAALLAAEGEEKSLSEKTTVTS